MCQWLGPHALSFGRQLSGLPSRVEYISPQGVLLPLVYGRTASPLWFEVRGHSAWQATPSWTVSALLSPVASLAPGDVCPGPRCSLAGLKPVALEYRSCPWPGGSAGSSRGVQPMGCWFFPVPRPPYVCAVSRASWLRFTGVLPRFVVLCLRCPGPLGSCSPVHPLGVVGCVCDVPGPLAPVHRCARWMCCVACAVSWAIWLLFAGAPAPCVAFRAGCPRSLGSYSSVCLLCLLFCLCGVLGHLAPVHRSARAVCCVVSAVSWATWLLFTGVPAGCDVLRVWRPGPLGPRSPVCPLGVLCCLCSVQGHSAPVHRCAHSVCCFACAVSGASWHLFTGVPGRGVPSLCCSRCTRVCGVLALVAPVHRCARCVWCACSIAGCVPLPPPLFLVFFWNGKKRKTGARVHCRHRHGQLVPRCNSVVSSGVCRRCCGGGRAPGVRLARPDVHGYGSGWVWLGVSLLLVLAG